MKKGLYRYMAWRNQHNGVHSAISVALYPTLEKAREKARENGLKDENGDIILRYHEWRGWEDKEYKINN